MEASEKARKILFFDPKNVDQDLYQVLAFIIDQEESDWADASGVDDVESQLRKMPDKVNGKLERYMVEHALLWCIDGLPRTSVALYSNLWEDSQKSVNNSSLRRMMINFSASASDELDLKNAARLLRSLTGNIEKPVNSRIDIWHFSCEVLASVVLKLNKVHPYIIEMDKDVKLALTVDIPKLNMSNLAFSLINWKRLETNLRIGISARFSSGKLRHRSPTNLH